MADLSAASATFSAPPRQRRAEGTATEREEAESVANMCRRDQATFDSATPVEVRALRRR